MKTKQQMTHQMALQKLRTRWHMEQTVSPTPMLFGQWLKKHVGLEFYGWQVVRDNNDNVKLQKIQ